ncbi:MAG TPA: transposase [Kofleriaceae bacterium]
MVDETDWRFPTALTGLVLLPPGSFFGFGPASERFCSRGLLGDCERPRWRRSNNPNGGKRAGAGRPPKGKRAGQPHTPRPDHQACNPLHITVRVASSMPSLRKRDTYLAVREATITTARREDFRIIHASVQGDHIHMMVEAADKDAISRGMRGFQISTAMHLNSAISRRTGVVRRGTVFPDRYHMRVLTSPRAVRHALAYVFEQLAKARRGPSGLAAHVESRSVLERHRLRGVARARRCADAVETTTDLSGALRVVTEDVAAARRLDATRAGVDG